MSRLWGMPAAGSFVVTVRPMANSYLTRALRATDRRYVRIFELLGYARSDMQATTGVDPINHDGTGVEVDSPPPSPSDELAALRAEYKRVIGTRPFHGWDAAALRERIAKANDAQG